ncbi:nickel-dependent hydrogenase, large subunit [Oscillochloris trichoides DG-6]|uniref:Nickel-dependent hydrogenase, large subunit n=1 Tax=Oscillochloris trichoides DG-6 TaxID=765420 RepID=E1IE82_9CHLR|nr:nickel-dependent hydrogenase large subunit [Oscillochloris trichoides]EFO80542.1 nickel-dependent hydrogenase, large subunit [Oscillochloris trichoides DG-6]
MAKIAIDPVTRIEGHLRVEVQVENGRVVDAWSSSTMFRGMELILRDRDPRDAWVFTQRICGVCTTVHALASVRAVEDALQIQIPNNARLLRNIIAATLYIQDHVVHFYHLHALDWVDIVSALSADPAKTAELAQSISDWPKSTAGYFKAVQERIKRFVDSGQLGIFANGYWGHPAYKLPAEANLMAVAHYLEALDWQKELIKIHAILGGKNPHPQTFLVGGMASPIDPNAQKAINAGRIAQMRSLAEEALQFVSKVYIPDLLAIASFYKDWGALGGGVGNFLTYGDFPTSSDGSVDSFWAPRGVMLNKAVGSAPAVVDQQKVSEYVTHSWYTYSGGDTTGLHPWQGETQPNYTGPKPPYDWLDTEGKYSWLKTPRYDDAPMEVGPLARTLMAYASGHTATVDTVNAVLKQLGVGAEALFSTLGRTGARGIETLLMCDQLLVWIDELADNIGRGDLAVHNNERWNPASWPKEAEGWGFMEAPRGALGHWVRIKDGKIANYQCVVPTTWNGSPRDAKGVRGPYESALIDTPVENLDQPLEILRTIHSFDPCMACSVHLVDSRGVEINRIQVTK